MWASLFAVSRGHSPRVTPLFVCSLDPIFKAPKRLPIILELHANLSQKCDSSSTRVELSCLFFHGRMKPLNGMLDYVAPNKLCVEIFPCR